MRDFIWFNGGIIYVNNNCYKCHDSNTLLKSFVNSTTPRVICSSCGQAYYNSIREAKSHYPHGDIRIIF